MYCIISPLNCSCRFSKNTTSSWQLLLSDRRGPLCVTSPESPLCLLFWRLRQKLWWCISCRAWLCPLSSCLGYKTHSSIEYVTRKQMDSLTFKAKSTTRWWTVYLVVQHRPGTLALSFPKIVPTICVEKGIFSDTTRSTELLTTNLQHWFCKLWRSKPCRIVAGGSKLGH